MDSKFDVKKADEFPQTSWILSDCGSRLAEIYMDHLEQVKRVVLLDGITADQRRRVLQIAGSHILDYVVHREVGVFPLVMTLRGQLSEYRSAEMLESNYVSPKISALNDDDLREGFRQIGVPVEEKSTIKDHA